ncbi:MAG: DNA repair exonuclease [Candidatus Methanomethylicia archaeon]
MRIAHISDTHLGYRQYNIDDREIDIYDSFNEAIDNVLKERVDIVIHSGDLFDSPTPSIKALKVFKECMRKISDRVKFLAVLGDHDTPKRRGLYPHSLFDEVKVLGFGELDSVEVNGVLIAGISNLRGRSIDLLRLELKKFDAIAKDYSKSILILHQGIDRYLPFEGAYEIREDEMPRSASYYAMGHLHNRVVSRFGGGFLAYAGSTEIISKDEISSWVKDGKGFYIVDFDGDEPNIHKINLTIRPQISYELDIPSKDMISGILKNIDGDLKNMSKLSEKLPIIHSTIKCKPMDRQQIFNTLNNYFKDKVLSMRINLLEEIMPISLESIKDTTNLKDLLSEILKKHGLTDERFVNLALELHDLLGADELEEAKKLIEKFFEVS